jgi:hypothetical protein
MTAIVQNWKRYFINHNEGIGTTYERVILHRYFKRLKDRFEITNILEAPSFGMTGISGINSMWWVANGAQVTVVDDNEERLGLTSRVWYDLSLPVELVLQNDFTLLPFENGLFDMSWNFAALRFLSDIETFLKELTRVTKKVIFLCIPNSSNIFNIYGSSNKKGHSTNNKQDDSALKIKHIMMRLNWELIEEGYLDIPPWPDIAMAKEDMLRKMGLDWFARRLQNRNNAGICILDYFNGKDPKMEVRLLKYNFLEDLPDWIKKLWGHHQYFIFLPNKVAS